MLTPELAELMRAVADRPDVTLGKALHQPGLMVGGKLFAFLWCGDLVVKLPDARIDALIAQHSAKRMQGGEGSDMREWVVLPAAVKTDWLDLVREACRFVAGDD